MPITVQWDNDSKNILRYELQGKWTWDEFYSVYATAKGMLEEVAPQTVHFIMLPLEKFNQNYLPPGAITHVNSVYRMQLPNSGATAVVGGGGFARAMLSVLGRISPKIAERFVFVDSLEEARAFLGKKTDQNPQSVQQPGEKS